MAVLLWLAMASVAAYELVPASVLPLVTRDLGVGEATASWLVGGLFLGMAVSAIPAGIVLDRTDNRHAFVGCAAGVLVLAATSWHAASSGALGWLVAARFVSGAFVVGLWTSGVNATGTVYAVDRQATGIGFFATAVPVGIASAHLTGARIAGTVGWEGAMLVFAGFGVLAAAGFWLAGVGIDFHGGGRSPRPSDFVAVLNSRPVWIVSGLAFVAFSLNIFFLNWLPSFLVDRLGVTLALGGGLAALFPTVGALGRASSGLVSDRFFGGRRRPVVLGSFLVIVPFVATIVFVRAAAALLAAIVLAGFVTQIGGALLYTYVRELVPSNVVSTALAVLNLVGFLGAFSAPVVTGLLFEATHSHAVVFGYAGVLAVVGVAFSLFAPEPA